MSMSCQPHICTYICMKCPWPHFL
ncbi:unnamed protein product [Spirodela intermedia]|uniref:Uncharacterized protein n=1 Tax=Spirodela intermedia TaxID=51605 RepID=A0A7I8LF76_SPIIN|nr:unnamed protein product [Spirodela intermedia]